MSRLGRLLEPHRGPCDPAVNPEARVPYTADYYFWKATGGA
jgi:hypothetical protein